MPAVARLGDAHACGCRAVAGSPTTFVDGKPVHRIRDSDTVGCHKAPVQLTASSTVFADGKPVARVGDNCTGHKCGERSHPPNPHTQGSPTTFAN